MANLKVHMSEAIGDPRGLETNLAALPQSAVKWIDSVPASKVLSSFQAAQASDALGPVSP